MNKTKKTLKIFRVLGGLLVFFLSKVKYVNIYIYKGELKKGKSPPKNKSD